MIRLKIAIVIALASVASRNSVAQTAADSDISDLYQMLGSVGVHPMVQVERANIEAARHRIAMKSSLMNPMLMLGIENLPTNNFSFSEEPMTAKMIGISQSFPFPGKLRIEGEIAAVDTITASTAMSEQENTLARDIKLAYFDIYHLERSIATNEFHVHSLEELLIAERSKLTTGSATQSEILNLELEKADIQTQIVDDQMTLAMRKADLERALGKAPTNLQMPTQMALPRLAYGITDLDSIASHARPKLAGLRAQADQQVLQSERSRLNKYPDFDLSLQYMQRDALLATSPMNPSNSPSAAQLGIMPMPMAQSDMVSATLSIELPINYGDQREEASSEANAMRTMKLAEERATALDIHADLKTNLAKLQGLRREYAILQDTIYPVVQMSLKTSQANYTYGKATIEQVLRDELNLLHREHDRYRLEAEYNKTLAEIEYLTGQNLVQYSSINDWK